ncbi:hypothetical protein EDB85DRAFT_2271954 [Lactarius pseudohatsudake]|nr:hypothetical protein EDB85DRAFT_2271954 [Lactarius pseudohatsudake]
MTTGTGTECDDASEADPVKRNELHTSENKGSSGSVMANRRLHGGVRWEGTDNEDNATKMSTRGTDREGDARVTSAIERRGAGTTESSEGESLSASVRKRWIKRYEIETETARKEGTRAIDGDSDTSREFTYYVPGPLARGVDLAHGLAGDVWNAHACTKRYVFDENPLQHHLSPLKLWLHASGITDSLILCFTADCWPEWSAVLRQICEDASVRGDGATAEEARDHARAMGQLCSLRRMIAGRLRTTHYEGTTHMLCVTKREGSGTDQEPTVIAERRQMTAMLGPIDSTPGSLVLGMSSIEPDLRWDQGRRRRRRPGGDPPSKKGWFETIWRRGKGVSRSGKGRVNEVGCEENGTEHDGGATKQEEAQKEAQRESRVRPVRPNEG